MAHGLISNEVLLAKIETTYGTDPTPAANTDAVLCRGAVQFGFDRLRMAERPAVRASLGKLQQIYGGSLRAVRVECEVKGSGTAGTAPEIGPLLQACGLAETVVEDTSVTYAPTSSSQKSVTLYFFAFGRVRHIISGVRGNMSLRVAAGDLLMASFDLIGIPGTITDQTQPTPTYQSTVPVAIRGLSTTIGGVSGLVIQNYELNLNNTIEVPDSVAGTEGYGNVTIVDRDPTIALTKHADLVATHNPWSDLTTPTARALASGTLGSTAGNKVTLTCSQMHYRNIEPNTSGGFRGENYVFGCHESSSQDDEFSLVFT